MPKPGSKSGAWPGSSVSGRCFFPARPRSTKTADSTVGKKKQTGSETTPWWRSVAPAWAERPVPPPVRAWATDGVAVVDAAARMSAGHRKTHKTLRHPDSSLRTFHTGSWDSSDLGFPHCGQNFDAFVHAAPQYRQNFLTFCGDALTEFNFSRSSEIGAAASAAPDSGRDRGRLTGTSAQPLAAEEEMGKVLRFSGVSKQRQVSPP